MEIKPKLYYNGGVLFTDDKFLIAKENYNGKNLYKFPGGMQSEIDFDKDLWIINFKELLFNAGFSEKEVEFLYEQEILLKRTPKLRGLIRKFLIETGIYPSIFQSLCFVEENMRDKIICKNFFLIKGYFQAKERRVKDSGHVSEIKFYYGYELLSSNFDVQIFHKHKYALEKALDLDLESKHLNIESLSEFTWQ